MHPPLNCFMFTQATTDDCPPPPQMGIKIRCPENWSFNPRMNRVVPVALNNDPHPDTVSTTSCSWLGHFQEPGLRGWERLIQRRRQLGMGQVIRYPNNWMVNTKLDIHICGPTSVFHFDPHPVWIELALFVIFEWDMNGNKYEIYIYYSITV